MFNCVSKTLLYDIDSNPPLEDEFYTCPEQLPDGRVRNGISSRPLSNHSPLEGLHYDELVFGLRAKLNTGVRLQEVPPINLHSDPTEVLAQANTFVRNVSNKFNKLREKESSELVASVSNSTVEPSNS